MHLETNGSIQDVPF